MRIVVVGPNLGNLAVRHGRHHAAQRLANATIGDMITVAARFACDSVFLFQRLFLVLSPAQTLFNSVANVTAIARFPGIKCKFSFLCCN